MKRPRRKDDGRFLDKDVRAWRRLIKAARVQVRAPLADTKALRAAGDACLKAVFPPAGTKADFLRLVTTATGYWVAQRAGGERLDSAVADLTTLTDACEAALMREAEANAPRQRADIFG